MRRSNNHYKWIRLKCVEYGITFRDLADEIGVKYSDFIQAINGFRRFPKNSEAERKVKEYFSAKEMGISYSDYVKVIEAHKSVPEKDLINDN